MKEIHSKEDTHTQTMELRHIWCFQLDKLYGNLHNYIIVAEHTKLIRCDTETEALHRTEEECPNKRSQSDIINLIYTTL